MLVININMLVGDTENAHPNHNQYIQTDSLAFKNSTDKIFSKIYNNKKLIRTFQ